ncbi:hypothetical protein HYH02_010824 [Chlamydomonas schloesseri]|uniref:Phosphoribulokinase/uridine kinase domain-containing protein n=1 Tax=Chlamydomonas schloesseri TaxID=2026947 RepID=A0A835T3W2_9CHLO|nr:hypothetical protein HYH02_010824 [Chlamydomonas schloesseri]|eukprot:KAG2438369.1 hypothetical protein HYH02_010824 [Chlamydomonas schloesseri]
MAHINAPGGAGSAGMRGVHARVSAQRSSARGARNSPVPQAAPLAGFAPSTSSTCPAPAGLPRPSSPRSLTCAAAASPSPSSPSAAGGAAAAAAVHAASAAPLTGATLVSYILEGPLLGSCGISEEGVRAAAGEWERLGRQLAAQLDFEHDAMDAVQKLRIYHYYLPVYWWAAAQLEAHRAAGHKTALVLGISAPQGCGKTTIVEQLEQLFNWLGRPAASVSIDDFYLTHADQNALAAAHPGNRLLQLRGNAGTHDLALGTETIKTLRNLTAPGATAAVPRYNKSTFGGRGDRAEPASWPVVCGPLDVVFFEGWMSGFAPLPDSSAAQLAAIDPALPVVNEQLRGYRAAWDELVDSWLVIRIGDPQWVFKWRLQAEERMKAGGKAGMSAEQIADFVSRFIPAYAAYLPGLYGSGPTTARHGRTLIIEVDQNRSPVAAQPPPVV